MQMVAGIPDGAICSAAGRADLQHYKRYRPPFDESCFTGVFRGTHCIGIAECTDGEDEQEESTALDDELQLLNHDPDIDKD